jgi:hypothetical protein
MLKREKSFSDIPRPSVEGTVHGRSLRRFYMTKVTNILGHIIDKRQKKFMDFTVKFRELRSRVPAVYISVFQVENMSRKYLQFNLSDEEFEALNNWAAAHARQKVESNGLLDQMLYYKYTALFYYSFVIRIKGLIFGIRPIIENNEPKVSSVGLTEEEKQDLLK